jgi:hypothetical protein
MLKLRRIAVLLAGCALTVGVWAQVRTIPDEAKRGEVRHVHDMLIDIDGVQQRLAPGAQIRDSSNRVIVPTALPAGAQVKYVMNGQGHVRQVWILTPEEAAQR